MVDVYDYAIAGFAARTGASITAVTGVVPVG
jgi:hypothetical protein